MLARSFPCAVVVLALAAVVAACGSAGDETGTPRAQPSSQLGPRGTPSAVTIFSERAQEVGLDFVHFNGMSGEKYSHEALGGGGALLDFDNDGDLDLYLSQGCMQGKGKTLADAIFSPQHPVPLTDRLYRNDLVVLEDGTRQLEFTDVTDQAGLQGSLYGMGVTAGDYDRDGWVDIYVTNFGPNQLLHNDGDGTFTDVTEVTGTDDPRWSVPAAFVDFDRDGWLDLMVGNYLRFTTETNKLCRFETGLLTYCGPVSYPPEPDRLFRNRGDGTFEDVTHLISGADTGAALGVAVGDFNLDGWMDIYVANDALPNHLWINQQDGTLANDALIAGVAVNMQGDSEGSMGVTVGDIDNDGDEDLVMGHIDRETNTVYVNDGTGYFEDASTRTGLGGPSWNYTGFGMAWLDYDNDSWLDLIVVNGSVYDLEPLVLAGDRYALHQKNHLYRNVGEGRFQEISGQGGPFFDLSEVSRAAIVGDVDNDGDTDVVVVNNNGPVRLLINNVGQDSNWIGFRVVGGDPERHMLGAWVSVHRSGKPTLWRRVGRDGSYASARDARLLVGLGDQPAVDRVVVEWPDGTVEAFAEVRSGQYNTVRQGTGLPAERPRP